MYKPANERLLPEQAELLHTILKSNQTIYSVIQKAEDICKEPYYIGAGCIAQTVWNYQNGYEPMYGISDIDFVYFDDKDLSYETENQKIQLIRKELGAPVEVDIKNQARVHLWYEQHFGYPVDPYRSLEDAINTWPTTASAAGVRLESGKLAVYAPFGLDDLFAQIIRANKVRITREIYEAKVTKWTAKWNTLNVVPWETKAV